MNNQTLLADPEDYGLLTDLYQLTMAACYVGEGLDQRRASFELFTRHVPLRLRLFNRHGALSGVRLPDPFTFFRGPFAGAAANGAVR